MTPERWKQIDDIFQQAADMPPADRGAFLDTVCGNDADLLSEVRRLLMALGSADDFIEASVWTDDRFLNTRSKKDISDSLGGPDDDPLTEPRFPETVGAFRLVKELGRGGMGAVYLAERNDGEFSQLAAIKLIKRGMDSDFIVRRFRHERQILASFEHPHIARLLDGGTTPDGTPYFIMEYIEGESLYRYCDKRKLDIPARLKLFVKICSAVQYAHEKQIVHRDIKPGNILINHYGSPKLLDFGVAKILDPDLIHESVNPTASMLRMLTPDYASPEQMQGAEVTPSSDIYSLGVLLYELLTGHRPFLFGKRSFHEITKMVSEEMPLPPSRILENQEHRLSKYADLEEDVTETRSTTPKALRTALLGALDNIVMKAMAKDATDRFASVKELSADISRHLAGEQIAAPPFRPRHHNETSGILRRHVTAKTLAVLPFRVLNLDPNAAADDGFLGHGLADALIMRLSKVKSFIVRPSSSVRAFSDGSHDPIEAGRELKADLILEGTIKKANDRVRVSVQLLDVAENSAVWATSIDETLADVLVLEDTISGKVIDALLPELTVGERRDLTKLGTSDPEAFEQYVRGRYHFNTFTEEGLAKAFVCFHSAIAADPDYALAYCGIADYYNWIGIIGVLPPKECFPPSIEAARKAVELDNELPEAHASLGFSLHAGEFDWAGAEHHLRRALELNPANAVACVWYSIVLYTQGRFDEGLKLAEMGVELDPMRAFNHHNVGWGLYFARRYDAAAERYRHVVTDFPGYGFGYYGLSKIHRMTGDHELAFSENEAAHDLMGKGIFTMMSQAETLAGIGRTEAVYEILDHLKELSEKRHISCCLVALVHCALARHESSVNGANDQQKISDHINNAFFHLEKAVAQGDPWLNWTAVDPAFDIVRDDERFIAVLEKTGYASLFREDPLSRSITGNPTTEPTTLRIEDVHKTASDEGEQGLLSSVFAKAAVAILALLVVAGAVYYLVLPRFGTPSAVSVYEGFRDPRLVVLPFKSSDIKQAHLGLGLADALSNKLGNIKRIQVISPVAGRSVQDMPPAEIHRTINASFIVEGTFGERSDPRSLTVKMTEAASGIVLWTEDFSAEDGDLFSMQSRMAERIWTSLGIAPQPLELQQVRKVPTTSPRAYELYLMGRYLMSRRSPDDLRQAISTFAASVAEDENFAPAYVGMADAHSLLRLYEIPSPPDAYDRALEYAAKALEIDPDLAEAHNSIAYVRFYAERNRAEAELEFRRAITLNPSLALSRHWFALFLSATGKHAEALEEVEAAHRLDPRSPSVLAASAMVHYYAGRFDEAISEANKALDLNPSFLPAIRVMRWTYCAKGDLDAAAAAFDSEIAAAGVNPELPGWQVIAAQVGRLGSNHAESRSMLDKAAAHPDVRNDDHAFALEFAVAYLTLDDNATALKYLERAEAASAHGMSYLEADARFAKLKGHPAFSRILEKLRTVKPLRVK